MRRARALWAGVLAIGCAGAGPSARPTQGGPGPAPIHVAAAPNEKVTPLDLNHDGKPDVWEFSVTSQDASGKPVEHKVRREIDINADGKVDLSTWYDAQGRPTREALDLDFDGKVDQQNFYEAGEIVRKERDLDGDGRTDQWTYLAKGQIVRVERDTNRDGKVDAWEYWENGRVDRLGYDTDFDGKVDRWEQGTARTGP